MNCLDLSTVIGSIINDCKLISALSSKGVLLNELNEGEGD